MLDPESGNVTRYDWPRERVLDLRVNRYHGGLWVRVEGDFAGNLTTTLAAEVQNGLNAALRDVGYG